MKRDLWTRHFREYYAPPWPCPACPKGTLAIVRKSLIFKETERSKRANDREDWCPEDTEYAFTAWLKCQQSNCGQEVAVVGSGGLEPEQDDQGGITWSSFFAPRYCLPMPNIIEIPRKCPNEVKRELQASFTLSLADTDVAAGRLRVALERLMDALGVQKRRKAKGGNLYDLSLHERIELLQKREPTAGSQLMALKWLGNVGSHQGGVKRTDLLDAFEILEHSLAELIDRRTARMAALAKELTKKHRPRGRKKGITSP